jgi:hypothetical protein
MRTSAAPWPLLLLLALAVVAGCGGSSAPVSDRPPAAPEPIGPRGEVSLPFAFAWKSVPGDSWIYRVTVIDAAERVLYERDIRTTTCNPSRELKGMLADADHATFSWTVSVLSPDGTKVVARSAPLAFSIK